jgi:hypothetical protein
MKRILLNCLLGTLACVFFVYPSYAQAVSSLELISNAKEYDGKTLTYQGEAIGDIMTRGEHAWVNLNDGYTAIGVWIKKADLKDVTCLGSYRAKGDIIEISGTFNRSCPEHGGDLDIHAQKIKKILPGGPSFSKLSKKKFYIGLTLTLIVLFLYFINMLFRDKLDKN